LLRVCLGVSSQGLKEEDYNRITAAKTLARWINIYISGSGTDSTEKGRMM
jgi:hypothetical protein